MKSKKIVSYMIRNIGVGILFIDTYLKSLVDSMSLARSASSKSFRALASSIAS